MTSFRPLRRLFGHRQDPRRRHGDSRASAESALDLADIQGFVLRGYMMPVLRHFLLRVEAPAQARRQLGRLVNGDESDSPQVTTAEDWHVGFGPGPKDNPADAPRHKPDYCLNIGFTWPGLVALEAPGAASANRCPSSHSGPSSKERPAEQRSVGRHRRQARPRSWVGGFGSEATITSSMTLHAVSPRGDDQRYSDRLSRVAGRGECLSRDLAPGRHGAHRDAERPTRPDRQRFTSATPTASPRPPFAAGRTAIGPDHQQPCEPWLFVLRQEALELRGTRAASNRA